MSKIANNEIQVKIPEVGDVWVNNDTNLTIHIKKIEYGKWKTIRIMVFKLEGILTGLWVEEDGQKSFEKHHTYIGKAKHNVEDLFKTENE